jgi:hypothetical protein
MTPKNQRPYTKISVPRIVYVCVMVALIGYYADRNGRRTMGIDEPNAVVVPLAGGGGGYYKEFLDNNKTSKYNTVNRKDWICTTVLYVKNKYLKRIGGESQNTVPENVIGYTTRNEERR